MKFIYFSAKGLGWNPISVQCTLRFFAAFLLFERNKIKIVNDSEQPYIFIFSARLFCMHAKVLVHKLIKLSFSKAKVWKVFDRSWDIRVHVLYQQTLNQRQQINCTRKHIKITAVKCCIFSLILRLTYIITHKNLP